MKEGWEIDRVAEALRVASKSIERWENTYEIHGCVDPPTPLRGRPRVLTNRMTEDLRDLIVENPLLLLDEISE